MGTVQKASVHHVCLSFCGLSCLRAITSGVSAGVDDAYGQSLTKMRKTPQLWVNVNHALHNYDSTLGWFHFPYTLKRRGTL